MSESSAVAVAEEETVILEQILVSCVHGAELVHFHIDYALHVASLKRIPGYLLGERRKLNRFIEYHEVFLRPQLSLAIVNLMIPLVLPYEAVVLFSS